MKNLIVLLTIVFAGCTATKNTTIQKDTNNSIQQDFSNYLEKIASKDFTAAMEYLVPEFFEIFPKQEMINIMEETFNNPLMEFNIKNPKILDVAKTVEEGEKFYSKLSYTQEMEMKMGDDETESEAEKAVRIIEEKKFFDQSFGEENVSYNEETGYFVVKATEEAVAVSLDGKSDWKFLVIQKNQQAIAKKLIPETILETFDIFK